MSETFLIKTYWALSDIFILPYGTHMKSTGVGFTNLTKEELEEIRKKGFEARKAVNDANKSKKYTTLRAAVNAHCKGCIYDPLAGGTWLQQVDACEITKCEMYEWRPRLKITPTYTT